MNPSNYFGNQQGAFQAPNNANHSGRIFNAFTQQNILNTQQNVGFGQTSTFGQSSAFSQPPGFGQASGQTSVFGQSSAFGQTPSFGQSTGQTPTFGQSSLGQPNSGFVSPAFPQSAGQTQGVMFSQPPAFGQTSPFGQQTSGFGIQSGISQGVTASPAGSGGTQPMSFGPPTAFSQPAEISTTSWCVAPKSGFGVPEFSFKPSNEAVFKPIFSASPEPTSSQTSSEAFGTSKSAPTSMDSSGPVSTRFSLSGVQPGFSFSHPAAAPSISGLASAPSQRENLATSSSSTTSPQFTFSQPAVPSNSNTSVTQTKAVLSSPSAFTFSAKVPQGQGELEKFTFGGVGTRQSAFGEPKMNAENKIDSEVSRKSEEHSGENAFSSFGRGTKRKEETHEPIAAQAKTAKVAVDAQCSEGAPRQPLKRSLLRNRTGGLFENAMRGVLKSSINPVKREPSKEDDPELEQTDRPDPPPPYPQPGSTSALPPRSQAPTREVFEKAEEIGTLETTEPEASTPEPLRRQRQESSDSVGGLSPTDLTVLQCKGVPPNLNKKDVIEKHFSRFGRVRRVFCRPQKNLAIIHFQDHAIAAKAKKRGKSFHGNELSLFWQRKKQSPSGKGTGSMEGDDTVSTPEEVSEKGISASPLGRPLPRSSAVSSSASSNKGSPLKKTVMVKSQFESDPQQDAVSEGPSSERPVSSLPSSLLHLVGQLADTAEEKYRLLEQRDKILRQGGPKRTDLDMSKVFVGTCPDMCPEKERYMRETRNQLSSFEVEPETEKVDHYAAIKEYSRSSADQEEPLPHDLRPLPVLTMTMAYLVTQIMDQGEGNYADWYDFVWNRTRGIRKDITQQHLCDPATVSLIEKCMRFHIHCAHHLCQEPMMAFDAKINNENMTKCLQSLKEMYQDLATRNIYCPNEVEFRQYSVLLKLNDGDILREVQQFREEVRNSIEVKFAVQAFAALNSNNFVRFFKLVKNASYLASCILHRYFNQVRGEALRALNIAYTIGSQRPTAFPIDNLVRMLMFRNTDEAAGFIQHYGLAINDSMVELSRIAFQEPELSLPPRRSLAIEKKRTVLIGQVVNGGPLPNPPQHVPVCSFDSQNKYRGEQLPAEPATSGARVSLFRSDKKTVELETKALLKPWQLVEAQPQATDEPAQSDDADKMSQQTTPATMPLPTQDIQSLFQPIEQPQPDRPPSPPLKQEVIYSDQDIMAEVESVVEEVLVAEVAGVAKTASEYVFTALSVSGDQLEVVVSEVVQEMLQDVSAAEINAEKERIAEEQRKQEEARRKREREAFFDLFSTDLCQDITEEVIEECVREITVSEIQFSLEEKAACVARSSKAVCESLVEETLELELCELAQDILDAELKRIHKFIKKWRDVVAVRRQLKRQMRGFPAAPCCVDPRFKLKALAPSASHVPSLDGLGNAGNVAVSCTRLLKFRKEAFHQMRVHFFYSQLLSECVWNPLDLPTLVAEAISNPPERIFWKAMLMLPSSHESDASLTNRILTDWLEAKFSGGWERVESSNIVPAGALQTLTICNGLRQLAHRTHKVHVCIKVSRGPLDQEAQVQLEENKELLGTNALLMLLPPNLGSGHQQEAEEDVPLLSALLQLKQVQQASSWHAPLPLAVLVPGHKEEALSDQKLEEDLKLMTLVEDGLISEYIFIHIPETTNDMQGTEQVGQAVKWLVAHSSAAFPLTSQTLVDFVEAGLCHEFSSRLYRDKQDRSQAGLHCQDPALIIKLYNSVLLFLANLVSSEQLSNLSWPPAEFSLPETRDLLPHLDWNAPSHLAWLKRAILSLQLPEWDLPPVTASWPCLCSSIFQYVSRIPSSRLSQPLLMSRLENLLGRVHSQSPGKEQDKEDLKPGPSFKQMPWDEIIALCIDHRLKDWRPPECPLSEDAITTDGQILVYFQKDALSYFVPPASWDEAVKCTHQLKQQDLQQSKNRSKHSFTSPINVLRQQLFPSIPEVEDRPSELDLTHIPSPRDLLPQRLLSSIKRERADSQRFGEQLRDWLEGDSLDTPSLPLFLPSTLLTLPELIRHSSKPPSAASLTQDIDDAEKSGGNRLKTQSIAQRIQDLDRTIAAIREEELAFELTFNSLLDIVDD